MTSAASLIPLWTAAALLALSPLDAESLQTELGPIAEPAPAASADVVSAPDGVAIHYDVQGEGDLTLVFVHGWNCDRGYWAAQRDFFARSHRVVTVDLAGHGDSGQNRGNWTMQAFGQDVAAVVTALELRRVVLIGHSMGGKVVVEAARQLGSRVAAVVGVDTFHNGGRATPQLQSERVRQGLAGDYEGFIAELVARMFVPQSDPAIREWVTADMMAAPYAAAVGAREASGNYDATPAIALLEVPLILISSDYLPTDLAHLQAHATVFRYVEMSDVGHFVMLEDPAAFNAHLGSVLTDIT
ncbi:alpha/beta fold hydrolase [Candidatus Foliamicus sp.]